MAWKLEPAVRLRLVELVQALDERNQGILTCVSRVQSGRGSEAWFVIRDLDDMEITRIPTSEVDENDPRAWLNGVLQVSCVECGTLLLEDESGLCGPCEAQTIMGLLRLREGFG